MKHRLYQRVGDYPQTLRNIPEERRLQLHCSGSLKFHVSSSLSDLYSFWIRQ